jgi:hypothetical protein
MDRRRPPRARPGYRLTPWLVAGFWTAIVIAGVCFWWPLLLVSWHYWFGGGG